MTSADEPPTVHVFHDYVCPYAYTGWLRAKELARDLPVTFRWLPWEIHPATDPRGEPIDVPEATTTWERWLEGLVDEVGGALDGPGEGINSNLTLRGAEVARDRGDDVLHAYHEAAFEAVWSEGRNVGRPAVLREVAADAGMDPDAFLEDVRHPAYQHRLDAVDRAAEVLGIQRVPTFVFGDQRIVGNDPFEGSLRRPLEAFLERWKALDPDGTTELAHDVDLEQVLLGE